MLNLKKVARFVAISSAIGLSSGVALAADSVDTLKRFVSQVKSGESSFVQVVASPDGKKKTTSSGTLTFERPNRFRFNYLKPYEQLIVADGQQIAFYDPDLNQVTIKPFSQALGSTPISLLAGGQLDKDFALKSLPDAGGLSWVQAKPLDKESTFQELKIGFQGTTLTAIEILDGFGQRTRLDIQQLKTNVAIPVSQFRFTPPAGADVIRE